MISAVEALQLDCAGLTDEQRQRVEKIMSQIDAIVRKGMRRNGCDIIEDCDLGTETDSAVVAEVNQRVKDAGWIPTWKLQLEAHPINKAIQRPVGYKLLLSPSDAAYDKVRISHILNSDN